MDRREARLLLSKQLFAVRARGYGALARSLPLVETCEVTGPSGTVYQVEIQTFWDGRRDGDIRVTGSIDNGGLRWLVPLTDDFIIRPDGTCVGE